MLRDYGLTQERLMEALETTQGADKAFREKTLKATTKP